MDTIQMTGKTVEEAIEIALRERDVDRGEAEIDVISRGKAGVFGIGSEPAKVKVSKVVLSSSKEADSSSNVIWVAVQVAGATTSTWSVANNGVITATNTSSRANEAIVKARSC